jgi:glycosyltransferase involved in cell wall biosynthesis
VDVETLDLTGESLASTIGNAIRRLEPDWVVVSDDKLHVLLDAALQAAPDRVVLAVHTHMHLPFGPEGRRQNAQQLERFRQARSIIAASGYVHDHLYLHAGLQSTVLRFPVYGKGPFEGPPERGFVTMINPCLIKGLPVFLALAAAFPEVLFAAVPTWGADDAVLGALAAQKNVRLLPPSDDIGEILRQTRVLLVPSLIPETFGYVAVEAMLRGIPVLASDLGGLPEAKLGVDYLLPVRPASWNGESYDAPPQDATPWQQTLLALLSDPLLYERCFCASRDAASFFHALVDVSAFESYFDALAAAELAR